ncbi:MAG: hypothetical protein D6690_12440 [Nitrospirae bacterium]|nr:MAG: hypothetical protein D6690_12440 [Nitrospirota bacterium]
MELKLFKDHMANWKWLARMMLLANVVLGACVFLLAHGLLKEKQILHVLPMAVAKEYWASADKASADYIKAVGLSLLPYITNVTPVNVDLHHEQFLKYVAATAYGRINQELQVDRELIKKHQVSRAFFVDKVVVEPDRLLAMGVERRWIGRNEIAEERRGYELRFVITDWQPRVVGLRVGPIGEDGKSIKEEES